MGILLGFHCDEHSEMITPVKRIQQTKIGFFTVKHGSLFSWSQYSTKIITCLLKAGRGLGDG